MKFKYVLILIFLLFLMLFKVYVANELYYTSRNIQKLSIQINALKEERNILKLKIEKLKYKNTIIDPLFEYQPKPIEQTPLNNQQDTTLQESNDLNLPIQNTPNKVAKQKPKPKKRNKDNIKEIFKNHTTPHKKDNTKELFQKLNSEELF